MGFVYWNLYWTVWSDYPKSTLVLVVYRLDVQIPLRDCPTPGHRAPESGWKDGDTHGMWLWNAWLTGPQGHRSRQNRTPCRWRTLSRRIFCSLCSFSWTKFPTKRLWRAEIQKMRKFVYTEDKRIDIPFETTIKRLQDVVTNNFISMSGPILFVRNSGYPKSPKKPVVFSPFSRVNFHDLWLFRIPGQTRESWFANAIILTGTRYVYLPIIHHCLYMPLFAFYLLSKYDILCTPFQCLSYINIVSSDQSSTFQPVSVAKMS